MSTITKELAKLFRKITNSEIDAEGNAHVVLSPADSLLINNARIALASLEAEPVAFVKSGYALCYYRPPSEYGLKIGDKLYAAAQPATVVPDEQHSERFDWTLGQWAEHVGGRHQGGDPANYYEFGSFMAVAAMLRQFGTVQQKLGWNAFRAAMLQAGNSPAIPDGYVMVPKEPTQAMCAAFNDSDYGRKSLRERYVAMLAAAQQPQDEPQNIPEIIPGWIPVSERMPDDDDFVYIWPRPDFGVELHVGQYCECSPKGDGWYAQVYEQNYGIEWYPITVTHWMPLPAAPQEVKSES